MLTDFVGALLKVLDYPVNFAMCTAEPSLRVPAKRKLTRAQLMVAGAALSAVLARAFAMRRRCMVESGFKAEPHIRHAGSRGMVTFAAGARKV